MLEIKTNIKAKHDNYWCEPCQEKGKTKTETQEQIYKCTELNNTVDKRPKYKEIFGKKITKMKEVLDIMTQNVKKRNEISI